MPTIPRAYATPAAAVSGSNAWTAITNASGKDTANYATCNVNTTVAGGAPLAMEGNFGIQALLPGSGAVVSQIRCTLQYATNATAAFSALTGRFWGGSTVAALGSATALTTTANAFRDQTVSLSSPTYAQLQNLKFRVSGTKTNQAAALYVNYLFVEVDYMYASWSAGASGDYSVWGDVPTDGPPTGTVPSTDYTLATQFELTGSGKYLRGLRFWRPDDAAIVSTGVEGCLYLASAGTEVANSRIAFGPLTDDPAGGWAARYLPTPLLLTPGEQYIAAIYFPSGIPLTNYAWIDRVNGPVRATAGINSRLTTGPALAFPAGVLSVEQSYWVDPMVGNNVPPPAPEPGRRLLLAS